MGCEEREGGRGERTSEKNVAREGGREGASESGQARRGAGRGGGCLFRRLGRGFKTRAAAAAVTGDSVPGLCSRYIPSFPGMPCAHIKVIAAS